jgi:mitochondrial fission protein ELM1
MNVLWLKDSKAGHRNKAGGLLRALGNLAPVEVVSYDLPAHWSAVRQLVATLGRCGVHLPVRWLLPGLPDLGAIDLIVSAGGATQWANAALAREYQKVNVFLGSPRHLPGSAFALIASHDAPVDQPPFHRFALIPSLVTPAAAAQAAAGLAAAPAWGILIGGDGEGVSWTTRDYQTMLECFLAQARAAGVKIFIATSRRTPAPVEARLRLLAEQSGLLAGACWFHSRETNTIGVLAMLGASARLCVTIDSMSMTHEAVSSGRPVVVIAPAGAANPRMLKNVHALEGDGRLTVQPLGNLAIANASPASGWNLVSSDPAAPLAAAVVAALARAQNTHT